MPEIDNLLGSTRRVVEEQEPLNNCRGVTYRVLNVDGGGSVDYTKVVSKIDSMPIASLDNADIIYLYDGETDANYTHGYIYENVATTTSSSASAAQTVGSGLSNITVDLETLESFTGWTTDNSLQIFYTEDGWSVDTTSLGVTYTGTPNVGDAITITYTAAVTTYAWTRVDVQPAGSSLPSQSGQSGKFLKTNGTDASWGSAVENIANGQRSFIIGGDYTNSVNDFISIGYSTSSTVTSFGTYCVQIGGYSKTGNVGGTAIGYSSGASGVRCTAVGYSCNTGSGYYNTGLGAQVSISGTNNVAIGAYAQASDSSVSIGGGTNNSTSAEAKNNSIAIGYNAHAKATKSIQLGEGTNSTADTFSVANTNGNYTMMDANGKIPADRLGTGYDPTKTQTLKNVQGVLTWVDD